MAGVLLSHLPLMPSGILDGPIFKRRPVAHRHRHRRQTHVVAEPGHFHQQREKDKRRQWLDSLPRRRCCWRRSTSLPLPHNVSFSLSLVLLTFPTSTDSDPAKHTLSVNLIFLLTHAAVFKFGAAHANSVSSAQTCDPNNLSTWTLPAGFVVQPYHDGKVKFARSLAVSGNSKLGGPWITYVR